MTRITSRGPKGQRLIPSYNLKISYMWICSSEVELWPTDFLRAFFFPFCFVIETALCSQDETGNESVGEDVHSCPVDQVNEHIQSIAVSHSGAEQSKKQARPDKTTGDKTHVSDLSTESSKQRVFALWPNNALLIGPHFNAYSNLVSLTSKWNSTLYQTMFLCF